MPYINDSLEFGRIVYPLIFQVMFGTYCDGISLKGRLQQLQRFFTFSKKVDILVKYLLIYQKQTFVAQGLKVAHLGVLPDVVLQKVA